MGISLYNAFNFSICTIFFIKNNGKYTWNSNGARDSIFYCEKSLLMKIMLRNITQSQICWSFQFLHISYKPRMSLRQERHREMKDDGKASSSALIQFLKCVRYLHNTLLMKKVSFKMIMHKFISNMIHNHHPLSPKKF